MLFNVFPLFTRIIWILTTILECFFVLMLLRGDAWKRYPAMSLFVTWEALGGLTALLIACFTTPMSYMPYFVASYGVTLLAGVIAFAVALELYYKVFDPRLGIAVWRPRHLVIIISVSLMVAITVGFLWTSRISGPLTRRMETMQEVMNVALWITFCILVVYSRSLGFTWRPRPAGIATGFTLYLTVSVVCMLIRARFSLGAALIANQVETAAEFLAAAWWLGVFWGEEKLPEAATSEQAEETVAKYRKSVEAAARLL